MGSVGNPNPWSPYDNFKDCSLQICSIYCPQFCYFIFPPPPPSGEDDDSTTPFSPLIIAIIGVLASAFLLVSYYTIVTRFCRRGNNRNSENEEINNHHDHESTANHDQWQVMGSTGLDEAVIKTIPFCKYVRGDGLIEGTECAVCLSEFQENESLRLLPKCSHAFHLPCIDTWLKSHSSCPLCRAGVGPVTAPVLAQDSSIAVDLDASNADLVLTVSDDDDRNEEDDRIHIHDHDEESVKRLFRRSVSLGAVTIGPHFLISEVLKIDGNDVSSRGGIGNLCNGFVMRRSVSTGRIP